MDCTGLRQLDYNRYPLGRDRAEAVEDCLLAGLGQLEHSERIDRERMKEWASHAVTTVMDSVCRSWRIPPAEMTGDSGSANPWDGAGYRQWQEAIGILAGELDSLSRFVPMETSHFCTGNVEARNWHRQRAVMGKLLLTRSSASMTSRWRSLRRRRMMKHAWRGGTGLDPQAGWEHCGKSLFRLAEAHSADPGASWLPGLLKRPVIVPTVRQTFTPRSRQSGRLVLVEYLFPGKTEIPAVVAGLIPEEARLRLSLQHHLCVRAAMMPSECGFCVYDQEEHSWHWHRAEPSLIAAREAEQIAQAYWRDEVLAGRPPILPVPNAEIAGGDRCGPDDAAATIASAWVAGLAVSAARDHETGRRERLEEMLRSRLAPTGRKVRTSELSGLCLATIERIATPEDLRSLGLDEDAFRKPGQPDGNRVLDELSGIMMAMARESPGAEATYRYLEKLVKNPPAEAGPVDIKRVIKELGDRVAELPSVSLRLDTVDADRKSRILVRLSAALEQLVGGVAGELINSERQNAAGGEDGEPPDEDGKQDRQAANAG